MNATTRVNAATNNYVNNKHIDTNFSSLKSNNNNNNNKNNCNNYQRLPTVTAATTHAYSNNCSSNNNPKLPQTTSNGSPASLQHQPPSSATSREYSSIAPYNITLTTMRLVGKELSAVANGEEARTKLMPTTAIKIISVNNNGKSQNNKTSNAQKSVNNSNSNNNNTDNNNHKSTTKSTATTTTMGAKLDSSMLINSRNQLSTTTTMRQQQQHQEQIAQQVKQQQQTEHMSSITRDLNQINLKSSLYAEQQVYNANSNNNSMHNCRGNNQQQQQRQQQHDVQTSWCASVSSNNKHNNAANNNMQKQQQQSLQTTNGNNNTSNKDCDQAYDNNNKSRNTVYKMRMLKYGDNNNSNSSNGSNEPKQQQQQQLITRTIAKNVESEMTTVGSDKISTTTKVSAEKYATTTTTVAAATAPIERAKAKTTKLTLRKSFSTPASFKIADVAATLSQCGNMIGNNNSNNTNKPSDSYSKSVSRALPSATAAAQMLNCKKSDSDGVGDDVGGGDGYKNDSGGGHIRGVATYAKPAAASSAATATKENFAPTPAIITNATQLANASIEAITTPPTTTTTTATATTIETHTTTMCASPTKLATMDGVTRTQTAAPQQDSQQQQQQQQHHQSSTKSAKVKDNDNQVICANKNISNADNVVVAAVTTTTSATVPLSPVSFEFDLRFGCAHYKRRAMFVTPCCNKFYKCRFCHDENESHHFDRKTLTELICSECNTRQKVQEQCEACGTRFGKYTCLICNLFDDTNKKQYHCNGCGICRIGGAENFFHCKVCDMCLPIRLKIDGHRCVENISRSHCPVCLGDIHTSRIPCHIPDCGHLLHKTCFDQLLNSGHYTCPICQTSLIDMTALWEYLDAQAVSLPVPKKYENQRIHIFCNDCHKASKTKFNFIGLKCMQCGAYNTTQDVKRHEPSSA
ncbi:putative uncharacterized protein DDB_G0286901 isoform X2 [Zeugodacus cucurbitae]|uniref:putative uncharacterized protein DDB_G0286901 isoform X2 n=1 Tax=Zeugodacus cucurbitae TaxID=28588 RepID=UPI0023D8F8C2|nr:putative uncharacterized protein DDB_G0286901 isoform X2 [Zeugodacus cucurbitae]